MIRINILPVLVFSTILMFASSVYGLSGLYGPCTSPSRCNPGLTCSSYICLPICSASLPCGTNQVCLNGVCKGTSGFNCTTNSQCTISCNSNKCGVVYGGVCTNSYDCAAGLGCAITAGSSTGTCKVLCSTVSDCGADQNLQICSTGNCYGIGGYSCASTSIVCYGVCNSANLQCGLPLGSQCASSLYCGASLTCSNSICLTSCSVDSDCPSSLQVCLGGVCKGISGYNCSASSGTAQNNFCYSNKCSSTTLQCGGLLGTACSVNYDCAVGLYCASNNLCQTVTTTTSTSTSTSTSTRPLGNGNTLGPNQAFIFLISTNQQYRLAFDVSGNLLLNHLPLSNLWSSNTSGGTSNTLSIESDGNVVIKDSNNNVIWQTGTGGRTGSFSLVLGDDGSLKLYNVNTLVWSLFDNTRTASASQLSSGSSLSEGQCIQSNNNYYKFCVHKGGKLGIYDSSAIQIVPTLGSYSLNPSLTYSVSLDSDCNLVLKDNNNNQIWSSTPSVTSPGPNCRLVMEENRNLVVMRLSGLWWSNTAKPSSSLGNSLSSSGPLNVLNAGTYIEKTISTATYRLYMQYDGNLVYYKIVGGASSVIWRSATILAYSSSYVYPFSAQLTTSGNLVVFDATSQLVWSTLVSQSIGVYTLQLETDSFSIYDSSNSQIWSLTSTKPTGCSGTLLYAGSSLTTSQCIQSKNEMCTLVLNNNGALNLYSGNTISWIPLAYTLGSGYTLSMLNTGNLVVKDASNAQVWSLASGIPTVSGPSYRLVMQEDCNLQIYFKYSVWRSNTSNPAIQLGVSSLNAASDTLWEGKYLASSSNGYRLWLQYDGNLVLYNSALTSVWSSNTASVSGNKHPFKLAVSSTGIMELKDSSGTTLYQYPASGTYPVTGSQLVVTSTGEIQLQGNSGNTLWAKA